jgi:hypothetical protein
MFSHQVPKVFLSSYQNVPQVHNVFHMMFPITLIFYPILLIHGSTSMDINCKGGGGPKGSIFRLPWLGEPHVPKI